MNYQKIYDAIIQKAKLEKRAKGKNTYYEARHIIRKCLGGTGTCNQWKTHPNIILLTAREHFICHWLLVEMYPNNKRLIDSFYSFCSGQHKHNQKNNFYIPSSRIYEYAKLKRRELGWHSEEAREKISKSNKGKVISEKMRKQISESTRGEKNNNYRKFGELHHNYGKNWKLTEEQAARRRGGNNPTAKKVIQYDLENNFIAEYSCIKEAKDKTGAATITECCKDYSKTSGGYKWKYK